MNRTRSRRYLGPTVRAVLLTMTLGGSALAQGQHPSAVKNVVLVHGGFVDGSGWRGVYDILKKDGFNVAIVQNPTLSLAGDAAATKMVVDAQGGPVILVGHSYGGAVITEAGTNPNVAALVYITAFAPDAGESVNTLIANPAPGAPVPPIPKAVAALIEKAARAVKAPEKK